MKSYIDYLLEDIKKAHRQCSEATDEAMPVSFEMEMEALENWIAGIDPPPSLAQQTGLSIELFPTPDKLTNEELVAIINAFHELLNSWHLQADIPSDVPVSRAYPLLIGLLDRSAWYVPGGMIHFDFCTGYAPDCELEEYCPCKKNWDV